MHLEIHETGNNFQLKDGWTVAKKLSSGSSKGLSTHSWTCVQGKYQSSSTMLLKPGLSFLIPQAANGYTQLFFCNHVPQVPELLLLYMPRTVWDLVNLHSSTSISVLNPAWIHKLGNSSPIFPEGTSLATAHLAHVYRTRHCTKYHSRHRQFN